MFFTITAFCLSIASYAQVGKLYSAEQELSNSLINDIYQDSYGFIWTSTEYGLNKYDGTRYRIYKYNEKDPTTIRNNYVSTTVEDNKQRLWIGLINGLMIYDRNKDCFKEIIMKRNGKRVYPLVTSIIQLHDGTIWIGTAGAGLFSYLEDKGIATPKYKISKQIHSTILSYIYEDSRMNIWIGTEDNGVACYMPFSNKIRIYNYPELSSNHVSSIAENNEGTMFIGTLNHGINKMSVKDKTFSVINNNRSLAIKSLTINRANHLLIGTDGQGLKIYNEKDNNILTYQPQHSPFNLSSGKVHSILEDRSGNLWLGIFQKGVLFLPNSVSMFNSWTFVNHDNHSIISGSVMSVHRTRDGRIWVGVDSEGLYEINKNGEILHHYLNTTGDSTSVPYTIMCMFEDTKGQLWLGSYTNGLALFNKTTGKCTYIDQLKDKRIYNINEDKDKNLFIATLGSGLFRYNLITHKLIHFDMNSANNGNVLESERLGALMGFITSYYDGNHYLWLGHFRGISCFDIRTNSFVNLRDVNKRLNERACYCMLKDYRGNIWLGTSCGLFLYNVKKKTLKEYTTDNGLSNEVISGICEDKNHYIWCSTYNGLTRLDPSTGNCLNFFIEDGLQGNEFTYGAFYKDYEGFLYFGGTNGITCFDPQKIQESKKNLRILITNFYLYNDKPINTRSKSNGHSIMQESVLNNEVYSLGYNDNTFTIEYSVMEFANPDRIIYEYKMEGLSDKWVSNRSGVNRVTYNNLRPGKYTFLVRAKDGDNYSNEKKITIIIAHPWYSTPWAFLLYFCILVVFGALLANMARSKNEQLKQKRLHRDAERINEAKLQFFINISHEIRTPMTLIINPLEKLLKETKDAELTKTLTLMYRNGQRILRLINQLLDVRKIDKGQMHLKYRETNIVGFIKDLMLPFSYTADKRNITFRFFHEEDELMVWIDLNNFDKVLMNLLSNAFKFTPDGGEISITLSTGTDPMVKGALKKYFEIIVVDNGIGLDPDKVKQIFERFYQINNDAAQSNFGTGIGLHLSRSLVELHHGTIKAENRTDCVGSKFIVRLPLGCNHLKKEELLDPNEASFPATTTYPNAYETKSVVNLEKEDTEEEKVKAKTKYKILIVEDENDIQNYLKDELKNDYQILVSNNGKDALELALTEHPDLIISDIMMPEMDGLTFCKKLKQNVNINDIPIILLTAKSKIEDRMEGLETGADAYFVKPFIMEELQASINSLLSNRELLRNRYTTKQKQEETVNPVSLKSSNEALMEKIIKVINEHISDPKFSVEELAGEVGLSRVHIHRKLKEITNQSASDFVRTIRLQQAASLLSKKMMSISDVAYAVGYTNLSHFSASFRVLYGLSPKEYMLKENEEKK